MGKRKLELQTGYIADAIIQTKQQKFNEKFTTIEEVNIIRQLIENKIQQKNLNVSFCDGFFKKYFCIINGVITKEDKKTVSLRPYISDIEIAKTIYDEDFIYLCLCEIMIEKLNNSIEHTCHNCNSLCCGGLTPEDAKNCSKWSYNFNDEKHMVLKKLTK